MSYNKQKSYMITNKIVVLKKDANATNKLPFKANDEFHIVMDVVYMNGFPLPMEFQPIIINWIQDNGKLFREIYR